MILRIIRNFDFV